MVVNKGSCFWQINFAEEEKVSKTSPLFALPLPFFSLVGLADTEGLGVGGLVGCREQNAKFKQKDWVRKR